MKYATWAIASACAQSSEERGPCLVFSKSIPHTAREHFDDLVAQHAPVNTYTHFAAPAVISTTLLLHGGEARQMFTFARLMRSLVSLRDYYNFMCDLDPTNY
jgi:hypothetical protein